MAETTRGMFAELLDSQLREDPYRLFAEWRRVTPVREGDVMVELGVPSLAPRGRPTFTLLRYDDITWALRSPEFFSGKIYAEAMGKITTRDGRPSTTSLDGEEHRVRRGLLTPVSSRKALRTWDEKVLRPVVRGAAEQLAAAGQRADLIDFALDFPMHIAYRIFGFEPEDHELFEFFQKKTFTFLLGIAIDPDPVRQELRFEEAKAAYDEIYELVLPVVHRRREQSASGEDLMSFLMQIEFEGHRLDDSAVATEVRGLIGAATENTSRQFLNTMTLLLARPQLLEAVRNDRALLPQAVVEGERCEGALLTIPRLAEREVEVRGTTIPAGATVVMALASGNRDPETFPDPDAFDIHRAGPQPLTFGFGSHMCPGMNLTRLEVIAAIDALLDVLPNLRLDPGQEPPEIIGAPFRGPTSVPVVWD